MDSQINLARWERRSEWPLAAAALLFLGLYSVQVLARPQGREGFVLWAVGWIIWGSFILDYIVRFCLASGRWRWFYRHLLDLAIVALPLVRPLRLLRLIVLIEVLQRAVGDAFRGRIVVYTVSGVVLLIYTASLAVFDKERYQPGATINSFGKALWWSITTVTTVGYGDVYPVTNIGSEEETATQAATAAHIDELRSEIRELTAAVREKGTR